MSVSWKLFLLIGGVVLLGVILGRGRDREWMSPVSEQEEAPVRQKPTVTFGDLLLKAVSRVIPLPSIKPPFSQKDKYVIAVYGDSMVETMGESLDRLAAALKARFPHARFELYNYGVGAENVEQGLARWDKPLVRGRRNYPPVGELRADVIIVGSYAYNPFVPHDRNRHWQGLAALVETAQETGARVYLLAEIAPREDVGWWKEQAGKIVEQLGNALGVAKSLRVGLVNALVVSQKAGSKFGQDAYVDPKDGIHPSGRGQALTAELMAKTLNLP